MSIPRRTPPSTQSALPTDVLHAVATLNDHVEAIDWPALLTRSEQANETVVQRWAEALRDMAWWQRVAFNLVGPEATTVPRVRYEMLLEREPARVSIRRTTPRPDGTTTFLTVCVYCDTAPTWTFRNLWRTREPRWQLARLVDDLQAAADEIYDRRVGRRGEPTSRDLTRQARHRAAHM